MSTIKTNAITTVAGKPILNSTGSILQVVQATTTSTISVFSSTPTASGLIASITPSSSSSKILVRLMGGAQNYGSTGVTLTIYMYRSIGGGSYSSLGKFENFTQGTSWGNPHSIEYLDSPATTSAVSYQPYLSMVTSNRGDLNDTNGCTLALTLMEVSA